MEASPRGSNGTADGVPPDHAGEEPLDPAAVSERVPGQPAPGHSFAEPPFAGRPLPGDAAGQPALEGADGEPDMAGEQYADLRPPRRLRLTQFAPIVLLGLLGSLMFAFPLAFAFDEAGAVVAMLGLLIGCSAAGWGMMAARRVGYTWPGLPPRGSGNRPDWRVLALYAVGLGVLATLAVWRVAALR